MNVDVQRRRAIAASAYSGSNFRITTTIRRRHTCKGRTPGRRVIEWPGGEVYCGLARSSAVRAGITLVGSSARRGAPLSACRSFPPCRSSTRPGSPPRRPRADPDVPPLPDQRDGSPRGNGRHMHFSLLDVDDNMFQQFGSTAYTVSTWVIPLVIAVTFHEASHGYVARLCGDDTAWRLGRVSFNPFKHIDPFGTILLPALLLLLRSPFLFGYAKPVPVNFRALRKPRRDMIWVAAAEFCPGDGRRAEFSPHRLRSGRD